MATYEEVRVGVAKALAVFGKRARAMGDELPEGGPPSPDRTADKRAPDGGGGEGSPAAGPTQ